MVCLGYTTYLLHKRLNKIEATFSTLGMNIYKRLEEESTYVGVGDRWFDEDT